jgi:hypothetical protein
MKQIFGKSNTDDEFHVIDLSEPVKIVFQKQVEDIIVSSPDGDILIGWDYAQESDFTPDNCMLLREGDKMKEITKERCTHFYMMPKESGKTLKVYLCAQK